MKIKRRIEGKREKERESLQYISETRKTLIVKEELGGYFFAIRLVNCAKV